jgi:serine protease Do
MILRISFIISLSVFICLDQAMSQVARVISSPEAETERARPEGGKYITIDEAILDLGEGDLTETIYASEAKRRRGRTARNLSNEQTFIEFSNSLAGQVMSELMDMGYLDTSGTFLPDYHNSLKLNVIIQEIHFDYIKYKHQTYYTEGYVELAVDFELRSHYGKELHKEQIRREISMDNEVGRSFEIMRELLNTLIEEFITSTDVQSKVMFNGSFDLVDQTAFTPISLPPTKPTKEISNWQEGVVTIIGEKGHGSACVLSSDGYILTNFHVVGQNEKVKVKWMNGDVAEASVLRKHPDCDLALIKVDKTGLTALPIEARSANIGEVVYVVGTPADTLLSQSVSKGIVSGVREHEGISLIQTDAKVNGGNSGGALISAEGKIIGVVSAKYVGYGIEGLGFAVPIAKLEEKLEVYVQPYVAPEAPKPSSGKSGKTGKKK